VNRLEDTNGKKPNRRMCKIGMADGAQQWKDEEAI
jgi:hypothetical protein